MFSRKLERLSFEVFEKGMIEGVSVRARGGIPWPYGMRNQGPTRDKDVYLLSFWKPYLMHKRGRYRVHTAGLPILSDNFVF